MKSVLHIARRIVADKANILDDYYRFYNDGGWLVEVVRKLSATLGGMRGGIENHLNYLPKLEECAGYLDDVRLDELGTASFAKEVKRQVTAIKKAYDGWEKAGEESRTAKYDVYMETLDTLWKYVVAFEKSCVNAFRNRYVEDRDNVRNLLDAIVSNGKDVLGAEIAEK